MTWQVTSPRGGETKTELGGEVEEDGGKGSRRRQRSECGAQTGWRLASRLLAAAPGQPAGAGEPRGRGKGRRTAGQAILYPPQATCHVPRPRALVSGAKLQGVVGWRRRLPDNTSEKRFRECGLKRGLGGATEEERISRRSRKDVFNLSPTPRTITFSIFRKAIVCKPGLWSQTEQSSVPNSVNN